MSLEFLRITLNSLTFQATLPIDKLLRTYLFISKYHLTHHCTKRELLSLLGHLNFAIRIISQGYSFISQLLSLSTAIPSLQDYITLDHQCKIELRM